MLSQVRLQLQRTATGLTVFVDALVSAVPQLRITLSNTDNIQTS